MAADGPEPLATSYVEVAIPVPLRRVFTYSVPDALHGKTALRKATPSRVASASVTPVQATS